MATYTQERSPLEVMTPLGKDALLLTGFAGHEGVSQLFSFQLDLLAEAGKDIPFDKLVGQPVTVSLRLADGGVRYFNGLCCRVQQGERDREFTAYYMAV